MLITKKIKDLQQKLNNEKWFTSKKYDEDLSGKMAWCIGCKYQSCTYNCSVKQKEKDINCYCAKNYIKRNK